MPIPIQKFFHTDNKKCQTSFVNRNIKFDTHCVLRKGVEISENKSFVACLADLYSSEPQGNGKIPTIDEMIEIIIDSIDLDKFTQYQNGNLVSSFKVQDPAIVNSTDISQYVETETYKLYINKKADKSTRIKREFTIKNIAASFQNFIDFLRDPDITVDYTHLWDIVCSANKKLFSNGFNLVVLNIPDDDITDNVELICPSNIYSVNQFTISKNIYILICKGGYYEPLIRYINRDIIYVKKSFSLKGNSLIEPSMKNVLRSIKDIYNTKCLPLASNKQYKFKKNISLVNLIDEISKHKDFVVKSQVMNYSNKVIGVIVNSKEQNGFVPCYPSNNITDDSITTVFMDDNIWGEYGETVEFLEKLHKKTHGAIPCKPVIKVIEDKLIVGILTETNQFVQIATPQPNTFDDDLREHNDTNYYNIERDIVNDNDYDKDRERYVKRIELESQFFSVFRNTIKILLNDFKNREARKELEDILDSNYLLYNEKHKNVLEKIKKLAETHINFVEYDDEKIDNLNDVVRCIQSEDETCKERKYCMTVKKETENGETICVLLIPKKNLLTDNDNEVYYYRKMADELIRFGQIRMFLFKPQKVSVI